MALLWGRAEVPIVLGLGASAAAPAHTPARRLPASAQAAANGQLHRVASAQSTANRQCCLTWHGWDYRVFDDGGRGQTGTSPVGASAAFWSLNFIVPSLLPVQLIYQPYLDKGRKLSHLPYKVVRCETKGELARDAGGKKQSAEGCRGEGVHGHRARRARGGGPVRVR